MVARRSFIIPPSRHVLRHRRRPSLLQPHRRSRSRGHLHHLHRHHLHHFRQEDDDDDYVNYTSAPASKQKDTPKEEPVENQHLQHLLMELHLSPSPREREKPAEHPEKVKPETELKSSVKEEAPPSTKSGLSQKGASSSSSKPTSAQPSSNSSARPSGSVTEEEIRNVLMQNTPITAYNLVYKFKSRLKTRDDREAFAGILKKIAKIQSTGGPSYVVLREQ